jgi:hypothetical protein
MSPSEDADQRRMAEVKDLVLYVVRAKDKLAGQPEPARTENLMNINKAQVRLRVIKAEMGL